MAWTHDTTIVSTIVSAAGTAESITPPELDTPAILATPAATLLHCCGCAVRLSGWLRPGFVRHAVPRGGQRHDHFP